MTYKGPDDYARMSRADLIRELCDRDAARTRYIDLFELAPIAYCVLDRSGIVEAANFAVASLFGKSRGALIGKPFADVVALADKALFASHLSQCFIHRQRVASDLAMTVHGRGDVVVELVSTPLVTEDGATPLACRTMLADITRLARTESVAVAT